MLSFLLPAALASLAAAQTKSVQVCNAGQCLKGTTNITNFGATLSTTDTDFILLPGTYTSSVSNPDLQKALISPSSTLSFTVGFTNNTAPTAPLPPSLPLSLALQPGVLSYPTEAFLGKPIFISQPTAPNSFNASALGLGSLLISPNTWVAIEATTGSSTSRVVLWDNFPFWSQLPPSLAIASSISLKDIQTSTCSPACSSNAICSTEGKCVCPTGFTGSSCETCDKGFFGPNCSKCPSNCDKCDEGPSGTGACLTTPLPSNAPSKCNCLNGSCSSSGTCNCIPGWANASNGTACATCDTGFFLDSSSGNCLSCGSGCNACSPTACTTCAPGTRADPDAPTVCIPAAAATCNPGTFQSGSSCLACSTRCATCTGPNASDCTSCPTNSSSFLRAGQCLAVDGTGTCQGTSLVVNKRRNVCDTCPPKCAKCSIPNFNPAPAIQDKLQCDQCLPGFVLDNGNCVETCPAGKVVSSDGNTCTACTNGCATCLGTSSFCMTCSSGQSAFNGQCVSSCPTNTFSSNGSCIPCHSDCATCSGPGFNQCKTCSSKLPVLASTGRCLPTCSKTEYFDASSGTCKSCDSSCGSCSTGGSAGCLTCASDKSVLRAGKCESVDCGSGSGTVGGLGVCLAELVNVPNNAAIPPVSIPPLDPNAPANAQKRRFKPQWWQILLMILGGLFIIAACIIFWRRQARKKRAQRTQEFKANLEHRGLWTRLWRNPFGIFKHKKRDNRARDLEGARSSAGDWRTSASRTDEDRRTWITMRESVPRRPSVTGESMVSGGYTSNPRVERSEGRSQRTMNRPRYLGLPAREQYGESSYGKEIEQDDDYRTEGSYSYRAPSTRAPSTRAPTTRDRRPRKQTNYSREQDRLYADLMDDQRSRGDSPSLYSQVTGQPRRRPEPKEPVRDNQTWRYSSSTDGASSGARKVLRKPTPQAPVRDFDMESLEGETPEPKNQRSDAELYKLSTMFPELKNQPQDHLSSGTTAVDRNPFRTNSY